MLIKTAIKQIFVQNIYGNFDFVMAQ